MFAWTINRTTMCSTHANTMWFGVLNIDAKFSQDASWGEFRRQLEYKAEWYGKKIVVIDRFFPSSQLCCNCHGLWSGTKDLSVRKWTCPVCGHTHDRDRNAAINILNEGLRLLA